MSGDHIMLEFVVFCCWT